jgi:hypothetical protein
MSNKPNSHAAVVILEESAEKRFKQHFYWQE